MNRRGFLAAATGTVALTGGAAAASAELCAASGKTLSVGDALNPGLKTI